MFAELIDRYKRLGAKAPPPKVDMALNQTYLQLYQAQRQRSFVDVQVEGNPEHYQSMVLELDPESRTVLIDELFPSGFVGLPGQQVSLSIRQSGGRKLTFSSVIQQQHTHKGSPLYVLAMPDDIATDQRRSSYRLPLANSPIESCFEGPDHQSYHGRVCNVSGTGVAIEIAAESANSFHYNDSLEHVTFDFAGVAIDCRMAVRSVEVESVDEGERLMIGAEFVDLSQLEKRVLEKSIMRVQRDRLKFGGHSEMKLALG
jgi:c-di-GMP-binding flagellar brake protein YcgR